MSGLARELHWSALMRSALQGDAQSYAQFLHAVMPYLGVVVRRRVWRLGSQIETEDVVQETLLAIHTRRSSWDISRPITPWIGAIAHHKTIDCFRRRGLRLQVPIDDFLDVLQADPTPDRLDAQDLQQMLSVLKTRSRDIVQAISIDGRSIRETANALQMSEGAVRVTLHRAIRTLAQAQQAG